MIRVLDPDDVDGIALVARRMRQTLVHVMGEERGNALYSLDWLQERVRFHLDPDRVAEVFLAEVDGEVVGHTIVRMEPDGLGLFSTTWVQPEARRQGIAARLVDHGEHWLRRHGALRFATATATDNTGLRTLFEGRGYTVDATTEEMVRLSRSAD